MNQDLTGQTIHDDAAANFCRYNKRDFKELSVNKRVKLSGVDGEVNKPIMMGSIIDDDIEVKDVVYTPNLKYNIDSQYQLIDKYGWTEDRTVGPREKRYIKEDNGQIKERLYSRNLGETHFVRVCVFTENTPDLERTIFKMQIIHENHGHLKIKGMMMLLSIYPADKLGFTLEELKLYAKHFNCRGCKEGQATKRRRDGNNNLIYIDYFSYGNKEGIHIDVFFIEKYFVFLLARSHRTKMRWMKKLPQNFKGIDIKVKLLEIMGDYKYANKELNFIRSDNAPTFVTLKSWMQLFGVRWYMAPPGMHTSKIERDGRTVKDLSRVIIQTLEYKLPRGWIEDVVKEAIFLLNTRYDEKLKNIPWELFYNEKINYAEDFKFKFGDILSYPDVKSKKSMSSNLYYGAIVGRDPTTGNLWVENLKNKKRFKISKFESIVPVDNDIREYFYIYEEVEYFEYSTYRSTIKMINNQVTSLENPTRSVLTSDSRLNYNDEIINDISDTTTDLIKLRIGDQRDASDSSIPKSEIVLEDKGSPRENDDILKELYQMVQKLDNNNILIDNLTSVHESIKQQFSKMENLEIEDNTSSDQEKVNILLKDIKALELEEPYIEDIHNTYSILATQMKYESMYKLHPDVTEQAGISELGTISDRDTLIGVMRRDIPRNEKIVYIMTRYVEKFKNGVFDKVKARTLLGGDRLKDIYEMRWDEVNARTVSLSTLYTCLAIMAKEKMDIATMDFKNAFLYANLPEEDQCFAKLTPDNVQILLKHDYNKWSKYVNEEDGCIYVKVKGALYGHPKAPLLWYEYLCDKLKLLGFKPLNSEACIFIRIKEGKVSLICMHVDDLFIGTKDDNLFDELKAFKKEHFNDEGTIVIGVVQEYLNMNIKIDHSDGSVEITQEPYWNKILNKFRIEKKMNVPHVAKFMDRLRERNEDIMGSQEDKTKFLSILMSILWGAKRSFPSVLFNVTALASQNIYGTEEDYNDAVKILEHIHQHYKQGIRLKIKGKVQLSVFVDSSCNFHKDTRGHGGFVISLGDEGYGGPVETNSNKAKTNGRSSLEYELFEVHAMLPSLILLREVLEELGYKQDPIPIFEDNQGMIDLLRRGKVNSGATKHIAAKYYYARDLMKRRIIVFKHCPTLLMIADIFTKNLPGPRYKQLMKRLINYDDQDDQFSNEVYEKLYKEKVHEIFNLGDIQNMDIMNLIIKCVMEYDEEQP
jgi:hypothetical protein